MSERRRILAAFVLAAAVVVMVAPSASAQSANPPPQEEEKKDPCKIGPVGVPSAVCGVGSTVVGVVTDPVGTVVGAATGVAGNVAGNIFASALDQAVTWLVQGVVFLLAAVFKAILSTTRPIVDAEWFRESYERMRLIGTLLLVPFLLAAVCRGIRTHNTAEILKAAFVRLPLAVFATAAAVVLTSQLLAATDGLSTFIASNVQADMNQFADGTIGGLSSAGNLPGARAAAVSVPGALVGLGAILAGLAALVIWIELLLRSAAVYIALAFLPLVLAAGIWPATVGWMKKLVEFLVAVILTGFVLTACIALAAHGMAGGTAEGFNGIMASAAVLLLTAAAPAFVLALVKFTEASVSAGRSSLPSPTRAAYAAYTGHMMVSRVMGSSTASTATRSATSAPARVGTAAAGAVGAGGGHGSVARPAARQAVGVGARSGAQPPAAVPGAAVGATQPTRPAVGSGAAHPVSQPAPPPAPRTPPAGRNTDG